MIDDHTPQTMAMQQLQGSGMNDWYAGYAEGVSDGQKRAADRIEALEAAARKALNYIENTESELGIQLPSGDALRIALAPEQDK